MDPVYVPLFSALAGALIGSLTSIVTIIVQARTGERRARIGQATTLALEELKIQLAHAAPGTAIYPISIYVANHLAILKALEKNELSPDRVRKMAADTTALMAAVAEIDREHRKGRQAV